MRWLYEDPYSGLWHRFERRASERIEFAFRSGALVTAVEVIPKRRGPGPKTVCRAAVVFASMSCGWPDSEELRVSKVARVADDEATVLSPTRRSRRANATQDDRSAVGGSTIATATAATAVPEDLSALAVRIGHREQVRLWHP